LDDRHLNLLLHYNFGILRMTFTGYRNDTFCGKIIEMILATDRIFAYLFVQEQGESITRVEKDLYKKKVQASARKTVIELYGYIGGHRIPKNFTAVSS